MFFDWQNEFYKATGLGFFFSPPLRIFKLPISRLMDVVLEVIGGGGGAYGGGTASRNKNVKLAMVMFLIKRY